MNTSCSVNTITFFPSPSLCPSPLIFLSPINNHQKLGMDLSNPFSNSSGFLNSQQYEPVSPVPVFTSQWTNAPSQGENTTEDRKGRQNWSPTEDLVLISAWLNTSKDPVVANGQKGGTFWKRIANYFAASPQAAGMQKREVDHCKQRWGKINDQVCKFVGCLEAATKQKSSGQNENDVMKLANQIYHNDHNVKFTLEHCWRELRHDQKWCASYKTDNGSSKRRKVDDGSQASGQSTNPNTISHGDEAMARPPGVKASKAKGKRNSKVVEGENKNLVVLNEAWEIKQKDHELRKEDYALKEKRNKHNMLDSLLAKTEPLSDIELALKNKLITDMLSNA
ncbi:PREDICTED: glutathione S-transferase T3-like [Camelina sativa]|uniref:Glutathione S-transferase T3-like n=1 Tax=Camelina sativa TaxID=90675 RepID=A0ABM0W9L1_CAMSA|nr:PREDICTED: glutathione S-transferase T3-like [Camelina sativa]